MLSLEGRDAAGGAPRECVRTHGRALSCTLDPSSHCSTHLERERRKGKEGGRDRGKGRKEGGRRRGGREGRRDRERETNEEERDEARGCEFLIVLLSRVGKRVNREECGSDDATEERTDSVWNLKD